MFCPLVSCVLVFPSPLLSCLLAVCWRLFPCGCGFSVLPSPKEKKKRGRCRTRCATGAMDCNTVVGCGLWAVGWCLWCVCYRSRERSTWSSAAILSKSRKQSHIHRGPELSPLALCLTPTRHDRAAGLCSSTLLRGYRYIAALGSYHHSFFIANARTATRTHQPTANAFQPII